MAQLAAAAVQRHRRGIENASGGHRQGTHSILGAAFFVVLAMMAGQIQLQTDWGLLSVGAGLLCMFMINIAAKALKLFPKSGFISNWIFALTMAGLVTWFAPHQWTWLPVSMLTGVVVHIVGDMITTGGVPLLWPIVDQAAEVPAQTAGAQRRLESQRGVFPAAAGPRRVAAGVAGADPRERLRHGGDVRCRLGSGRSLFPRPLALARRLVSSLLGAALEARRVIQELKAEAPDRSGASAFLSRSGF